MRVLIFLFSSLVLTVVSTTTPMRGRQLSDNGPDSCPEVGDTPFEHPSGGLQCSKVRIFKQSEFEYKSSDKSCWGNSGCQLSPKECQNLPNSDSGGYGTWYGRANFPWETCGCYVNKEIKPLRALSQQYRYFNSDPQCKTDQSLFETEEEMICKKPGDATDWVSNLIKVCKGEQEKQKDQERCPEGDKPITHGKYTKCSKVHLFKNFREFRDSSDKSCWENSGCQLSSEECQNLPDSQEHGSWVGNIERINSPCGCHVSYENFIGPSTHRYYNEQIDCKFYRPKDPVKARDMMLCKKPKGVTDEKWFDGPKAVCSKKKMQTP